MRTVGSPNVFTSLLIKAYSIKLVGSNQALSINDANQIRIQPFNNADMTQHWNIQKVKKIRL
ncbi:MULTISPECIES: hypothetical protein [Bacillus cereus group]|uniref:hypothetical protein n=1 Tax=Bacillus TaxID=1386 RepID=UPI00148361D3|nr:hypothetical protein [Bacillus cereus]HDR8028857.1 hypothetical protein [Bacillus cereus]HDR8428346.1 hypothetical protein [Bacillus cereus]HDR8446482.1 hypothetical protein [Bacillus cereus]